MTTTLVLEVEQSVLERAEEAMQARGGDVRSELLSHLEEIGEQRAPSQHEAMLRFVSLAQAHPVEWSSGLPNRDERNQR